MGLRRTSVGTGAMTAIKKEIMAAGENAIQAKFKDLLTATLAEQQKLGLLIFNMSQEVRQQQMVVVPPPVLGQASLACAQSSAALTTAQSYLVDSITSITPCLLFYSIGRAGKIKEVAKG